MDILKSVDLVKKANIYFDGNVTSRSFVDSNGEDKSLGIMMPGEYNFGTNAAELMEILDGEVEVKLAGSDTWNTYTADTSFDVPANSSFDIKVKTITDYCCSYIK
ncbi:pyrimidine/purine nucleoside phosphorylase [Arcobacter roscoffensis]|uniref:Pyrimidine/purine nucleoside phosphorylase n=1 Tax=Arcobacter roscoffensis TaxID=2961520 RepID=A0ABY5E6G6_9BACT|nr:pyrimidine/purine nucleoside phosphorylase [Arcobacter roscoffensis]UTJ07744.1 pyrimidine/purine nucleoside phosphorylase [Arcobacter roscoffensis]